MLPWLQPARLVHKYATAMDLLLHLQWPHMSIFSITTKQGTFNQRENVR